MSNLEERILARVNKTDTCWNWTGSKTTGGYGNMGFQGKVKYVHRLAYELWRGPIPPGLQIDHLCRNRACCNPDHLEPVTQKENLRRGDSTKHNTVKTHCPQGHEYTRENTYVYKNMRYCRTCSNRYKTRYQESIRK